MRRLDLIPMILLVFSVAACGGGDDNGGAGGSGGPAPLALLELAHKTATADYRLTMQAPDDATAKWSTAYFFVTNRKDFALRVIPRGSEDLAARKAGYEKLNIKGFTVLVDEPDALLVEVRAHSGTDFEIFTNTEIDGQAYSCKSVAIVGGSYTRAQAERILQCCRTLAAAP